MASSPQLNLINSTGKNFDINFNNSNFLSLFYLLMAVLYFFPIYYLYKYSSSVKTALQFNDSNLLADAFVNLKSHHKFLGISVIVILSLYLLIIIGAVITMVGSAAFQK